MAKRGRPAANIDRQFVTSRVKSGLSNSDIASSLGISRRTLQRHMKAESYDGDVELIRAKRASMRRMVCLAEQFAAEGRKFLATEMIYKLSGPTQR